MFARNERLTVLVINYNYGSYVGATINSIRRQTFKYFRCIVVDNGSRDDSLDQIFRAVDGDARFEVISLPQNIGQLGAIVRHAGHLRGDFVSIVDSDDVLLPEFFECHIHALTNSSAGLSTSRIVEIGKRGAVLTGSQRFRDDLMVGDTVPGLDHAWFVPPRKKGWIWAPGTANMYRRSALDLAFEIAPPDIPVDFAGDTLLNPVSHLGGGTVMIDRPLSLYRIHGANKGSRYTGLTDFTAQSPEAYDRSIRQRVAIGLALLRKFPAIPHVAPSPLDALDTIFRRPRPFYRRRDVVDELSRQAFRIVKACGPSVIPRLMARNPRIIFASLLRMFRRKGHDQH